MEHYDGVILRSLGVAESRSFNLDPLIAFQRRLPNF